MGFTPNMKTEAWYAVETNATIYLSNKKMSKSQHKTTEQEKQ